MTKPAGTLRNREARDRWTVGRTVGLGAADDLTPEEFLARREQQKVSAGIRASGRAARR